MTILSILIPSIPETSNLTDDLNWFITKQINELYYNHPSLGQVEVLIDNSKKFNDGGLSIGKKREALVNRASGKYLCFLDNDDWVSPNYIEALVRLCHLNADVVSFRNITKTDYYWTIVDMSINYPNDDASPKFITRRKSFHICPVLTRFAKMESFENSNYGEDWSWMNKVLTHCTTEVKTDEVLHEYRHSKLTSEADKITTHELLAKS